VDDKSKQRILILGAGTLTGAFGRATVSQLIIQLEAQGHEVIIEEGDKPIPEVMRRIKLVEEDYRSDMQRAIQKLDRTCLEAPALAYRAADRAQTQENRRAQQALSRKHNQQAKNKLKQYKR
jgi:predicted ATP-binding protein involved in virulence